MLRRDPENFLVEGSVSPEEVAEAAIRGIAEERFLIPPHPQVAEYFVRKAQDYDRWLRGMRRLQRQVVTGTVPLRIDRSEALRRLLAR